MTTVNLLEALPCACGCRQRVGPCYQNRGIHRIKRFVKGHTRGDVRWRKNQRLFRCARCPSNEQWHPAEAFVPNASRKTGISPYCRKHEAIYRQEVYAKDPVGNSKKIIQRRQHRIEKYRATARKYAHRVREVSRGDVFYEMQKRIYDIKKRKFVVEISADDLVALWKAQDGLCAVSGVPMLMGARFKRQPDSMSVDRIDSSRGYVKGNVRLVTYAVNVAMQEWGTERFLQMCRDVVDYADAN